MTRPNLNAYEGLSPLHIRAIQRKRRKQKVLIILAAILAILVFSGGYFQKNATRVLLSISEATMRASTATAVNDAVFYTLTDEMRYDDLVNVTRNDRGEIVSVAANALKINKIARDTASISQANLKNLSLNGIPVPIGALTGIEALAGIGPSVHFKIIPVSSVNCDFSSEFMSVGINQIKHSIYLNVVASISIVMPSRTEKFDIVTDILVGEFILVGSIPDTYLETDIFDNPLKLTP